MKRYSTFYMHATAIISSTAGLPTEIVGRLNASCIIYNKVHSTPLKNSLHIQLRGYPILSYCQPPLPIRQHSLRMGNGGCSFVSMPLLQGNKLTKKIKKIWKTKW